MARDRIKDIAIFFACYVISFLVGFVLMLIVQEHLL